VFQIQCELLVYGKNADLTGFVEISALSIRICCYQGVWMAEDQGSGNGDHQERRRRQRFVAKRWGQVCFWVVINGQRLPLNDLSLEGFSLSAGVPPLGSGAFPFVLQIEGVPDEIRGMAEGMNFVFGEEGGLFGCRFLSFEDDGAGRLHDWLTVHVIATATVRISEKDAAAIVTGPSLI